MYFFLDHDPKPFIVAVLMAFYLPLMSAGRTHNPVIIGIASFINVVIFLIVGLLLQDDDPE